MRLYRTTASLPSQPRILAGSLAAFYWLLWGTAIVALFYVYSPVSLPWISSVDPYETTQEFVAFKGLVPLGYSVVTDVYTLPERPRGSLLQYPTWMKQSLK